MATYHDVFEFIVDGTSGLAPGDVSGKALVAGACSAGTVGKIYYLGRSSDLTGLLGVGPLVDALRDIFATAGQEATILACPVAGQPGGYITDVVHVGSGPAATVSGAAGANADAVCRIAAGGALGVATYQLSLDAGLTYAVAVATPAGGQIPLGASGATLVLGAGDHEAGDTYAVDVRAPIGPILKVGTGPDITATGTPTAAAQVSLVITAAGGRNVGQYQLSVDGGDNYANARTIPVDGAVAMTGLGVAIAMPAGEYVLGDTYSFEVLAPTPTVAAVIEAITLPLETVDPEFIYVVGPSDSVDWAALGALMDAEFSKHRPKFVICEARQPRSDEDVDDWITAMVLERVGYAHRFISVVAAYGEVSDTTALRKQRNAGGLLVGRVLSVPVMRAIGRVRDGAVSQLGLPSSYTEAHVATLEEAGYIPAKRYASLSGTYWGEGKTLADATSDYQWIEVLRVVFKALRLLRIQALKSMYDEVGDPLREGGAAGLAYLQGNLEVALNTMVKAVPQELAGHVVYIPPNQDIVNNGVACEITLIGIPIIRKIKLYASYVYAGSTFDPRLSDTAA
jgi:hypothetical protein